MILTSDIVQWLSLAYWLPTMKLQTMRHRFALVAGCLSLAFSTATARAEHRVALIISNTKYKNLEEDHSAVTKVQQAFEAQGFRCQVIENLANEYGFRDAIESFTSRTPTRATAAIYFQGRMSDGSSLLATDMRGKYPLEKILQLLRTRGGSKQNLLYFDVPEGTTINVDVAAMTQLWHGNTERLLNEIAKHEVLMHPASKTISPANVFVPGKKAGDEWVNQMGLVFCWCPPGTFTAGSPTDVPGRYSDEEQRSVRIDQGFWISKYELAFSQKVAKRGASRKSIAQHKLDPMTMINHDDAKAMTRTFTASERKAGRLPADWYYTLPTEEQWEYAARAGTTTRYYFGNDMALLTRHANFADKTYYDSGDIFSNSAHRTLNDGTTKLAQVGSYQPNPWGLHDMYGNVAEWCINLAIRGGSWASVPENCRSAYRDSFSSRNEQNFIGYRLVIQNSPPPTKK